MPHFVPTECIWLYISASHHVTHSSPGLFGQFSVTLRKKKLTNLLSASDSRCDRDWGRDREGPWTLGIFYSSSSAFEGDIGQLYTKDLSQPVNNHWKSIMSVKRYEMLSVQFVKRFSPDMIQQCMSVAWAAYQVSNVCLSPLSAHWPGSVFWLAGSDSGHTGAGGGGPVLYSTTVHTVTTVQLYCVHTAHCFLPRPILASVITGLQCRKLKTFINVRI